MKKYFQRFIALMIKTKDKTIHFFKHNILFTTFIITSLLNGIFLRALTVKNYYTISPILADLSFIMAVGALVFVCVCVSYFCVFF